MFFPRRGCYTCKHRRIKCDRVRPVCGQCQKAKVECEGIVEDGNFIFLNENEYAGGGRKRRRGPNVTTATTATTSAKTTTPTFTSPATPAPILSSPEQSVANSPHSFLSIPEMTDDIFLFGTTTPDPHDVQMLPSLDTPLDIQALAYYAHTHVEVPHGVPEVMDGHLKYALDNWSLSQPFSILSLAISAVSHATFGRARRHQAALAVGCNMYSQALVKTNMALRDANEVTHDEVLLSAMLLSFYENSVMDNISNLSSRDIKAIGARSFAHHDGAMALLKLRRQRGWPSPRSMELDKLVRRQILRTLLLRNMPVPLWLRDGSKYGESGFALELDRYMVIVAKLRHQASILTQDSTITLGSIAEDKTTKLQDFLAEAQALDSALARWASSLPLELQYISLAVHPDPGVEAVDRSYNGSLHVYPTVGHAGLWNRYRALRLVVNSTVVRALSAAPAPTSPEFNSLKDTVQMNIHRLAEDLCESVPFTLGTIGTYQVDGQDLFYVTKPPISLKEGIKTSTAYFICWPLAVALTICEISEKPRQYLSDRTLEVSELVDDGVLEIIATTSVHSVD